MANQWFRLYSEFSTDAKVQMMSEPMQRRYLMLMCLRCSNTLVTLQDEEIAFQLRIDDADLAETKALFIKKGFIDSAWNLLNWEKRQFASDSSAARVAKHRALQKKKQGKLDNDDVTLQKRQANGLDTEQNRTEEEAKASMSPGNPDDEQDNDQPAGQESIPNCPHTELIDLYAEQLPTMPRPKPELWAGARAAALKSRWRWVLTAKKRDGTRYATSRAEALGWFKRFFAFVAESDFLTGRDGKWTACDLGWLCNETNFAKVVQGNYTNKEAA